MRDVYAKLQRHYLCFGSFRYLFKQIPTFQTLIDVYTGGCVIAFVISYRHNMDRGSICRSYIYIMSILCFLLLFVSSLCTTHCHT